MFWRHHIGRSMSKIWIRYWQRCVALLLSVGCITLALPVHSASDPLNTPARLSDKAFSAMLLGVTLAGQRLIAVGERGIIVYSDNAGKEWVQASVPVSVTLTAVCFSDPQRGWAVGHEGVALSTNDAGKTWVKRFDGNQANALMLAEVKGNISQARLAIDTATAAIKPSAQAMLEQAENSLADLQASTKFGPSRPLLGVWFKNASEGYLVGAYGQIFYTADGGQQWTSLASRFHNPDGLHFNSINSTSQGSLLIAGEGGKVYRSVDNGMHWQTFDTGYKGQLYGVLGTSNSDKSESLLAFGFGGSIVSGVAFDTGRPIAWQHFISTTKKNLVGGKIFSDGKILLIAQDGSLLSGTSGSEFFSSFKPSGRFNIASGFFFPDRSKIALAGIGGVSIVSSDLLQRGKQ